MTKLRSPKPKPPDDKTLPSDSDPAAGDQSSSPESSSKIEVDKIDPKQAQPQDDKAIIAAYDKFIEKMESLPKGRTFLAFPDPAYESGKTYRMTYLGRDDANVPFVGKVQVAINAKHGEVWDVTIGAGAVLYTKGRRYGKTRRMTDKVRPPPHLLGPGKSAP